MTNVSRRDQATRRPKVLFVSPLLRLSSAEGGAGRRVRLFLKVLGALADIRLLPAGCSPEDARRIIPTGKHGQLSVIGEDAEALAARTGKAATEFSCDAVIFMDGAAARAAIGAAKARWRLPVALVMFPEEYPVSWLRPSCTPDEAWCFSGSRSFLGVDGLLPGCFFQGVRPEKGWVKKRLQGLLAGQSSGLKELKKKDLASIIIPCFNARPSLKRCLDSVARWTSPPYEIIAVDNGSSAPARNLLERWRPPAGVGFRLIRNSANRGFAKAVNQGMRAAGGRYLVWLNSDVVVTPHWLGRLKALAARAPWIGAVGPVTNAKPSRAFEATGFPLERTAMLAEAVRIKNAGKAFAVSRLQGFCLLLKREAFERAGFLDERFGQAYFEDYDYCLRLRQGGYELAVSEDVFVYHQWHGSFADSVQRSRQSHLSRQVWIEKWCRRSLEFLEMLDEQDLDEKPIDVVSHFTQYLSLGEPFRARKAPAGVKVDRCRKGSAIKTGARSFPLTPVGVVGTAVAGKIRV